jgi:hypothetical protein
MASFAGLEQMPALALPAAAVTTASATPAATTSAAACAAAAPSPFACAPTDAVPMDVDGAQSRPADDQSAVLSLTAMLAAPQSATMGDGADAEAAAVAEATPAPASAAAAATLTSPSGSPGVTSVGGGVRIHESTKKLFERLPAHHKDATLTDHTEAQM